MKFLDLSRSGVPRGFNPYRRGKGVMHRKADVLRIQRPQGATQLLRVTALAVQREIGDGDGGGHGAAPAIQFSWDQSTERYMKSQILTLHLVILFRSSAWEKRGIRAAGL